jgi:predicted dehydrogenase
VRITAACDVNADGLAKAAKEWSIPETFTAYEAMLEARVADAVVIGTPMQFHAPQAIAALDSGVHVLSEVPAAVSVEECRQLVRAAAESRALYMMAENYCYGISNVIVREMSRAGLFGETYYAEGHYLHELKAMNEVTRWRRKWQTGIDGNTYITHELGPLLQWLWPRRVIQVACAGSGHHYLDARGEPYGIQDMIVTLGRLNDGGLVQCQIDMLSERPHKMDYYRLQGTLGAYESGRAPGETPKVALRSAPRSLEDGSAMPWEPLENYRARFLPDHFKALLEESQKAGHGGGDFWVLYDFTKAIREGSPPPIGIHEAMDMTLPGLISQQAVAAGTWLDVPDSRQWANPSGGE